MIHRQSNIATCPLSQSTMAIAIVGVPITMHVLTVLLCVDDILLFDWLFFYQLNIEDGYQQPQ